LNYQKKWEQAILKKLSSQRSLKMSHLFCLTVSFLSSHSPLTEKSSWEKKCFTHIPQKETSFLILNKNQKPYKYEKVLLNINEKEILYSFHRNKIVRKHKIKNTFLVLRQEWSDGLEHPKGLFTITLEIKPEARGRETWNQLKNEFPELKPKWASLQNFHGPKTHSKPDFYSAIHE
jgi:Cft2 family RNA processing exonuclease